MLTSISPKGVGVGLRRNHYDFILSEWPQMDWFEAISENYMDTGGRPFKILEKIRSHYPIALHGTSMSIGTTDPLDDNYLKRLKRLIQTIDPFIVSDHLCWSSVEGHALHDLLPLPFTEESLNHLANRVSATQDFLGRRILLENVSTYVSFVASTIPEWEFLGELVRKTGCGILLDVNNLYVNSFNHGFDPEVYLNEIPQGSVGQIHLAGHTDMGKFLFDTHSSEVIDPVWKLYEKALERFGQVSTLIEWDENIPEFERLSEEAERARKIYNVIPAKAGIHRAMDSRFRGNDTFCDKNTPNIPSLRTLQSWMRPRILQPERGLKDEEKILNPQAGDPGIQRLEVYASGYIARMVESLKEVYETIYRVLEDELFRALAFSYARQFPSQDYNLGFVGRHLPEFLKSSPLLKEYPYLYELSLLEWKASRAFHAFEAVPANFQTLALLTPEEWENTRLFFQPSVSILKSEWPLLDLWLQRRSQKALEVPLEKQEQFLLLSRKEVQVRLELLDKYQYILLELLLEGKTLGEACGHLAAEDSEFSVGQWFAAWVADGLIAKYELPTNQM